MDLRLIEVELADIMNMTIRAEPRRKGIPSSGEIGLERGIELFSGSAAILETAALDPRARARPPT